MKKTVWIIAVLLMPALGWAAGSGNSYPNDEIDVDWSDKAAMQRGAALFVNYCMGCHSLEYMRYNRMGKDLGISDELLKENLIFTTDKNGEPTKVGELMKINMDKEYAETAFGTAPPDLTLIARSRGPHWLYNYLRGFYVDESRPFGVNNSVFPNVGMPHMLLGLEGLKEAVIEKHEDAEGNEKEVIVGFKKLSEGSMSQAEYDQAVKDLVSFLDYVGEPIKEKRKSIGVGVLIFLFIFLILAVLLKKEYWKDVH